VRVTYVGESKEEKNLIAAKPVSVSLQERMEYKRDLSVCSMDCLFSSSWSQEKDSTWVTLTVSSPFVGGFLCSSFTAAENTTYLLNFKLVLLNTITFIARP